MFVVFFALLLGVAIDITVWGIFGLAWVAGVLLLLGLLVVLPLLASQPCV